MAHRDLVGLLSHVAPALDAAQNGAATKAEGVAQTSAGVQAGLADFEFADVTQLTERRQEMPREDMGFLLGFHRILGIAQPSIKSCELHGIAPGIVSMPRGFE